jgi:hypothetical protein
LLDRVSKKVPVKTEKKRGDSPGRAVAQLRLTGTNGSPPPIDPSEDMSSYTTETATNAADDIDDELRAGWYAGGSASAKQIRKYRKKVTFDLDHSPKRTVDRSVDVKIKRETVSPLGAAFGSAASPSADVLQTVADLTNENDQLRKTIADMERASTTASETAQVR